MANKNKENIVELYKQAISAFNDREIEKEINFFAEDYVDHLSKIRGRDELRQYVDVYIKAFPDIKRTIEDIMVEGNKVANRYRVRGTHQGEFMGVAPTGKKVDVNGICISRFEDELIAEEWDIFDTDSFLKQLGLKEFPG